MGRPERSLDPGKGPVERFAAELRRLRETAGRPGYRELSRRAFYSVATLAEAAGGKTFPSLRVTQAYVGACGGDQRYWEERWREVSDELAATPSDTEDRVPAPYRGLETFEPGDTEWFFGRQRLVDQLVDRLSTASFLAVFGPSGSGKSSVLRAGLLPALARESLPGAASRPVVLVTPGEHPIEALAARLAKLTRGSARSLRDDLLAEPESIRLVIDQALPDGAKTARVVFVVDQFEEVFTLCRDEVERSCFIDCLLAAADEAGGHAKVILGVRADFYAQCAGHPALAAALCDRQVLVGAMNDDELRQVISGPAAHAGLRVDRALIEVVVSDTRGQPGTLPLVSHVLLETWRRRRADTLTLAGYRAAGGIHGGIAQTAERVFGELDPERQRIAKQVFLRLAALGEGTEDTRRRVRMAELLDGPDSAAVTEVLERLAAARLLTVGDDEVQVAHEAVIRHWPRLRTWLSEDRELLRAHRRLTEAAAEWDQHGKDTGLLYRGTRLVAWETRGLERLNTLERAFLSAGRRLRAREDAARRRRARLAATGLLSAVVMMSLLAATALVQASRAADERDLAVSRQLLASAGSRLLLDPAEAVRLARQAYEIKPTAQAERALRQATLEAGLNRTLGRSDGGVRGVAFSPDGRRLAVLANALSVQELTRDGALGRKRTLGTTGLTAWALAFHPDGRYVASEDSTGEIKIWDLSSPGSAPVPLAESITPRSDGPNSLTGLPDEAGSIAFSPDGRWLASASSEGTVLLWDWSAPDAKPVVAGTHPGRAFGVAFSPNGQQIASSSDDRTIRIWDRTGSTRPVILRGHETSVETVTYSPDGERIASGGTDGTIRIWDATGTDEPRVLQGHTGAVNTVAYSPDGRWVASGGADGTIRIWDTTGITAPLVLNGNHGEVWSIAFAPDGRGIAGGSDDGTTQLWDVMGGGDPVVLRGHTGPVWDAVASPDGRKIASAGEDGTVRIWNADGSGHLIAPHDHAGRMFGVAFSPDGTRVAGAGEDGTIMIWNTDDGAVDPVTLHKAPGGVQSISFTPDGRHIVGANWLGLYLWNADQSNSAVGFPLAAPIVRHAVRIYQSEPDMWHRRSGLEFQLAQSADGRLLAVRGSQAHTIELWNLEETGPPVLLEGHEGQVRSIAFSPDGRLVATTADDDTVRIWNRTGDGEPLIFRGHGASAENINFTPDGRLITTYDDGTIRIWRCEVCGPIQRVLGLADQRTHMR